jgi:hypothetical protein
MACDLLAFTQSLCLADELATAEPKRLRYCLLHAAARLTRSGRRSYLRVQANWPWAKDLARAFDRLNSLVMRT